MRGKFKMFLLSTIAVLLAVFSFSALNSSAKAAVVPITGNTAADATMTYTTGGTASPTDTIYDWQGVNVNYSFSIANGIPINAGDTADFTLPGNVLAKNNLSFEVKTNTGVVIGTFNIAKGASTGTLTFNDNASQANLNRSGTLTITGMGSTVTDTNPNDFIINKNGWIPDQKDLTGSPTTLTWNVAFNNPASDLTNVKIVDTLGPNQTYINGSVHANTGYYLNGQFISTGTIEPTSVLMKNQQIIFVFGNVNQTVNMTYQVSVPAADANQVNSWDNNVTLQSSQVTEDASHTINWGGSGTGTGDVQNGSVILTKTDASNDSPLAGATFELLDASGNVIEKDLTTDTNGQIVVNNLTPGDYNFVETGFPVGYAPSANNEYPFTIQEGQTTPSTVSATNVPYPSEPEKNTGSAVLIKLDATSHTPLAGAVYDLKDPNGNVLITGLTTDEEGMLPIDNLAPGKYTLTETKAPTGYEINTTPIPFEIEAGKDTDIMTYNESDVSVTPPTTVPPTIVDPPVDPEAPVLPEEPGTTPTTPDENNDEEQPGTTTPTPTTPTNPSEPTEPNGSEENDEEQPGTTTPTVPTTPSQPDEAEYEEQPSVTSPSVTSPSVPGNSSQPSENTNEEQFGTSPSMPGSSTGTSPDYSSSSSGQGVLNPNYPSAIDKGSMKLPAKSYLNGNKLPQTGSHATSLFGVIAGIVVIVLAMVLIMFKVRGNDK
ncbi:LPXTG cell wall anchor domain-containing protein [Companilactobacillus furfuricola]|uniref:LPXTG cell wall anchor domain-containing protein n=1 Tax=Companilactobacillus furfuricola TaxID=1462575 RepID=UPI000F7A1C78|nr:LPXTG cell wall anchor domain-containing protein [Companilactobacillus furfuricola]